MSNRNNIKKEKTYKKVFDGCNEFQKKVIFFLAGCIDEQETTVNVEEIVKEHKKDNFMTVEDVLATMNRAQLEAANFILKACGNVHNKLIEKAESEEGNDGVHET
jgi:hypothetical protein